jgi:hypothetical protein
MTTRFSIAKFANFHRTFHRALFNTWASRTLAILGSCLILLSGVGLYAQGGYGRPDNRPDRGDRDDALGDRNETGINAGGNWTEYRAEDPMTAAKRVRFELPAENTRAGDDQARIVLYCTNGKLKLADFRPNVPLARPNWPGFWGQPQMRVRVRADDSHDDHSWNWVNGRFLAMDKGTAREVIGARLFRIEFTTPDGPRIAEFSPAGLDLKLVRNACDLEPKRH